MVMDFTRKQFILFVSLLALLLNNRFILMALGSSNVFFVLVIGVACTDGIIIIITTLLSWEIGLFVP